MKKNPKQNKKPTNNDVQPFLRIKPLSYICIGYMEKRDISDIFISLFLL